MNSEKVVRLIKLYEEYLAFLNVANQGPISVAHAHGWKCREEDIETGEVFRDMINETKDPILEENKKIEALRAEVDKCYLDPAFEISSDHQWWKMFHDYNAKAKKLGEMTRILKVGNYAVVAIGENLPSDEEIKEEVRKGLSDPDYSIVVPYSLAIGTDI